MTGLAQPAQQRVPALQRVPVAGAPDGWGMALPRLAVVIPARNEQRRLPRCLTAIEAADEALRSAYPGVAPSRVVVVLDRCSDRSEEVLADWPLVDVVMSDHGQVGAARALGVEEALRAAGQSPAVDWIACTDADSAVPVDWLLTHLAHAACGTDLLLGLVRPDPAELTPDLLRSWTLAHQLTDGHPHVHGANLGISAGMYRRAGGFPAVAVHEDVLLADRVRKIGGRVVSTAASPVLTSARTSGRTPAGMAGYLTELGARTEFGARTELGAELGARTELGAQTELGNRTERGAELGNRTDPGHRHAGACQVVETSLLELAS